MIINTKLNQLCVIVRLGIVDSTVPRKLVPGIVNATQVNSQQESVHLYHQVEPNTVNVPQGIRVVVQVVVVQVSVTH